MNAQPIPQDIRDWLKEKRHFTDETIDGYDLAFFEILGDRWVGFPVRDAKGNLLFHKLKAAPGNTSQNKGMVTPSGMPASLFGAQNLSAIDLKQVVICEGEPDCVLLWQLGFIAVSGTAGAGTFNEEWLDAFPREIEVVLCFDNDEAGEKGREKIREMMQEKRPDIRLADVTFDSEKKKGYDVTDFVGECLSQGSDPADAFRKMIVPWHVKVKRERVITQLKPPSEEMTIEEWRKSIGALFPDLVKGAETCLSVVCQLLIHDVHNPFALTLVDAPSTGKTICINMFDGIEGVTYATDHFTPSAFVTNIAGRTKEQLEKIDLLPRIRHKTLLVREMATMLCESDDILRQRMGQLTRVLDGEGYTTESGVHGQRGYKGDYLFCMLSASTPFPLRVWKLMSGLGHRLFFLGLHSKVKDSEALLAQMAGGNFKAKEKICKSMTETLVRTIWNRNAKGVEWDYERDEMKAKEYIALCALLLRRFRGEIVVYKEMAEDGKEITSTRPEIEDPSRINTCLFNLARGHAVASGRNHILMEDISVLLPVVLDTAADPRPRLMRALLQNFGDLSVNQVEEALGVSTNTAKKEMYKFISLGLCEGSIEKDVQFGAWNEDEGGGATVTQHGQKKNYIKLKEEFLWLKDAEIMEILEKTGVIRGIKA